MKMMRSTHTLITFVIAAILSTLFLVGYFILTTPNDKQALKYDQKRESDFAKLKTTIKAYRDEKDQLPESLDTLKEEVDRQREASSSGLDALGAILSYGAIPLRDPYSNRPYTYKYENRDSEKFQLCAKFFKENKGEEGDVKKGSSSEVKHGSGDQCVDFEAKKKKSTKDYSKYTVPQTDREMTDDEYQQYWEDKYKDQYDSSDGGSDSN